MTLAALGAVVAIWGCYVLVQLVTLHGNGIGYIDLLVYRAGGHAVLEGTSMYSPDFDEVNQSPNGLPFTYPPFSGLAFVPFALLPPTVAKAAMLLTNAAATVVFFTLIVVGSQGKWHRLRSWGAFSAPVSTRTAVVVVAAATLFVATTPVRETFNHGQVNMVLAAMVAADILLPNPSWPRGLLVGLAVAVKLTPAVFVGYFLVTRQWRALAVSLVTAAGAFALAWLLMPADTVRYFTGVLMDTNRIGGLSYASNQSIRGVLERIPALASVSDVLWLVGVAVVLAVAIVAIGVNYRSGDPVAALLAAAFIGLLCSPVSWGHHWIWLSAAAVYFLVRWVSDGGVADLTAGLTIATMLIVALWALLPRKEDRELHWTPLQHAAGSMWIVTALVLLVVFALGRRRPPARG